MSKTVCFVGHGQAGKDTAGEMLAEITGMKFAGTTSYYLAEHMGSKLGLTAEEAYSRRRESDEMRVKWFDGANELRKTGGLSVLAKMALKVGPITGGLRDYDEIVACRAERLFDIIVWVVDTRKPENDPTMKFGREMADYVLDNSGTKVDLWHKLVDFAIMYKIPLNLNGA